MNTYSLFDTIFLFKGIIALSMDLVAVTKFLDLEDVIRDGIEKDWDGD